MVEYALLLAGLSTHSINTISSAVGDWLGQLNWSALSYAVLALVALRIAFWAFHSDA